MIVNDKKKVSPLSLIDDFMVDEILDDHSDVVEDGALETILKSLDKAELALRKSHLVEIRAQIDRERRDGGVINVDAERMRAKLQAAANDTAMKMTLAARNAISDGDDDEAGLLEDLAELERDANQEKK
ncbi:MULTISPECIES: hypothetical protein [Sphingomonas]|uniref:hypothetical protein n=1 Tax=Sphingomonas TaxID=13687 RepID=UPI00082B2276|nr:hypothetical protein [Sphingomonas sp. CCH10-B3]